MKLKNVLLNEQKIDTFVEDCYAYLAENEYPLANDFFLKRASENNYDSLTKKSARKRKGVFSPDLYFFYEKYKPFSAPSRKELVPVYGKQMVETAFQEGSYDTYLVFPVGRNYKLYYHPKVSDFNYNPLLSKNSLTATHCHNKFAAYMGFLLGKLRRTEDFEISSKFNRAVNFARDAKCSVEVSRIMDVYPLLFEFLESHSWEEITRHINLEYMFDTNLKKDIQVILQNYENYFKQYFSGLNQTMSLETPMVGSEVGMLAPNGFYYLPENEKELVSKALQEV